MPSAEATVSRAGEALRFAGTLSRAHVAALWRQALPQLDGVRRLDLKDVDAVDSAGIALLAELASRCAQPVVVDGAPAGLAELRAAYRLTPGLAFASA